MPDISAAVTGAIFLIIICDFNPIDNPLGRRNLVWPHDHQHVFRCENAVLRENIQDCVLCEKCPREIDNVRDDRVLCISPERRKFKAV